MVESDNFGKRENPCNKWCQADVTSHTQDFLAIPLNSNLLQAAILTFFPAPPPPWGCQPHVFALDSVIVWSGPVFNKVARQGR